MNLPARFVGHGVVGRGSQAVVWLVTDTLRGERIALKVFHPQSLGGAGEQRLRREVQAASRVRSPAALLPFDVHAFDGMLALSMPFHPGRTLADRVQDSGRLAPAALKILAVRLLEALSAAHGAGVLHRDVSPNNVLLSDDVRDAVLADFGSARPIGATTTRSVVAGTLGYTAPEVLAGRRGDVRSDLYGLGAVLYLAATGKPVAEGGFAAQLSGRFTPVRERQPDVPSDVAGLIDRLLSAEPDERPDGASEALEWLRSGVPAGDARESGAERQFLPAGRSTVVVEERSRDRRRRSEARKQLRSGPDPTTVVDEVSRWGRHLADRVRENLGVPPSGAATPEAQLVAAVAAEAGVPVDRVRVSPVLWRKQFRLVEAVDRACAERLAEAGRLAGFKVDVVNEAPGWDPRLATVVLGIVAAVAWVATALEGLDSTVAIVLTVIVASFALRSSGKGPQRKEGDVVAYDVALSGMLTGAATPRFTKATAARKAPPVTARVPTSRGARLRSTALQALDGLATEARASKDLPTPFRDDLLSRARELSAEADALATQVDDLERQLGAHGVAPGDVERLVARLERARAMQQAGQGGSEIDALERALAQHKADEEAGLQVESRLAACTAQLLEIASTASRVRRELGVAGTAPPREAGATLRDQVDAMRRARREAERGP